MIDKLEEIKEILINAKKEDASIDRLANDRDLKSLASLIRFRDEFFPELVMSATAINKEIFGNKIDLYAVSYISDFCVNRCVYCGHNIDVDVEREKLNDEQISKDFAAALKYGPHEICILTGQHPKVTVDYLINAGKIAIEEDVHDALESVCFNVAPMSVDDYKKMHDELGDILQIRIFQESYDKEIYRKVHLAGPKRNFENRLFAIDRAVQAGIRTVGLGVLLGINDKHEPYRNFGNDLEIMSLIAHAYNLEENHGITVNTVSLPRHQRSPGSTYITPNPVDDISLIAYHAILKNAMPKTKIIVTNRERIAMRDLLRPMINIEDLAARPGVGGNYRTTTHMQNELGDPRGPLELLHDLVEKGYEPNAVFK